MWKKPNGLKITGILHISEALVYMELLHGKLRSWHVVFCSRARQCWWLRLNMDLMGFLDWYLLRRSRLPFRCSNR